LAGLEDGIDKEAVSIPADIQKRLDDINDGIRSYKSPYSATSPEKAKKFIARLNKMKIKLLKQVR